MQHLPVETVSAVLWCQHVTHRGLHSPLSSLLLLVLVRLLLLPLQRRQALLLRWKMVQLRMAMAVALVPTAAVVRLKAESRL